MKKSYKKRILAELKALVNKNAPKEIRLKMLFGGSSVKVKNNYKNFTTWRLSHPNEHKRRIQHYERKKSGYYESIPDRIKLNKKELKSYLDGKTAKTPKEKLRIDRGYYDKLPLKNKALQELYRQYRKGLIPNVNLRVK